MATGRVLIGTGQQGRQLFISKIDHRPEMVLTDETWTTERQEQPAAMIYFMHRHLGWWINYGRGTLYIPRETIFHSWMELAGWFQLPTG
ncbi:hypothetical protein T01_380 [Trichinella spiralis]|uniref:Uncharacterized protein n=1 Tax=Trichinella spiralis TaxID=6334 RepID=A0A0V1C2H9_TRISP|nr:hypothetical protein T01_380 [Trichinella spiralis]